MTIGVRAPDVVDKQAPATQPATSTIVRSEGLVTAVKAR
jgi:hypothetical protein